MRAIRVATRACVVSIQELNAGSEDIQEEQLPARVLILELIPRPCLLATPYGQGLDAESKSQDCENEKPV